MQHNIPLNLDVCLIIDDINKTDLTHIDIASALENIQQIKTRCDQKYSDQSFFGSAALNRKILLDGEIAKLLDENTLLAIFALRSQMKETKPKASDPISIFRNSTGYTTIADAIYYGFKEGLETIQLMPNNESHYGTKQYDEQKKNFATSTQLIVSNILQAAKKQSLNVSNPAYLEEAKTDKTLSQRFKDIVATIYNIKADQKGDSLLHVPTYSPGSIRSQALAGFKALCEIIDAEYTHVQQIIIKDLTLEEFAKKFINSNAALLSGAVGHLFYDRAHLEACIEQDTKIIIGGNSYPLRDILQEMIRQCESSSNVVAREQFHIRLKQVEGHLQKQFPSYISIPSHVESKEYWVKPNMAKALYEQVTEIAKQRNPANDPLKGYVNDATPNKFKRALELLKIETQDIQYKDKDGYIIKIDETNLNKILEIVNFRQAEKEYTITPAMAKALYAEALSIKLNALDNLSNEGRPLKFMQALKILQINIADNKITFNEPNGYRVTITEATYQKINTVYHDHLKAEEKETKKLNVADKEKQKKIKAESKEQTAEKNAINAAENDLLKKEGWKILLLQDQKETEEREKLGKIEITAKTKKAFLHQLGMQLSNPDVTRATILEFFDELKNPKGKYEFIHASNPIAKKVGTLFKSNPNKQDESTFWHTTTYKKAVKFLKEAYIDPNKTAIPKGDKILEKKEKEFINYFRSNASVIHRKQTATSKKFKT